MNEIVFTSYNSPIGKMLIASTGKGLCKLDLLVGEKQFINTVSSRFRAKVTRNDEAMQPVIKALERYFEGDPMPSNIALDLRGTPFQKKIWSQLLKIPHGETRSYKQIAIAIGTPTAPRAVGNAVGSNPVAIIVPCHRVLRSDGSLGGFGYGVDIKKKLLRLEALRRPIERHR